MVPLSFISTLLFFFCLSFPAEAAEPFAVEVLLDGVPADGGGWVLTVTLQAKTDLKMTHLTVALSDGLKIVAGEPHWQGTLSEGGEHVLELSMTMVHPPPQTVTIRVQGRLPDGIPFEKKIVRTIG
jgi:hypothetical protein